MNRRHLLRLFAISLAATGVFSLVFWLTLDRRLPTDDDWVSVHAFIKQHSEPGDAVVLAPAWATRGRDFITSRPVFTLDDFQNDELFDVPRVWLVALRHAPHFSPDDARALLGGDCGTPENIGALSVQSCPKPARDIKWRLSNEIRDARVRIAGQKPQPCPWRNDQFECGRGGWNTVHAGWYEVEESPMRCVWAHPVGRDALEITFDAVPAGHVLRGRGAFVARAAASEGAPVELEIKQDNQLVGRTRFENRLGRQPFEFPLPSSPGPASLTFAVTTGNAGRRLFCFDAWVEGSSDAALASPR